MSAKVTAELIREYGRALRRLEITEERAGELAAEVERLNSAVIDAAGRLDFNDDPCRFAALLAAAAQEERK
jgi:hypothetical protein